MAKAKLEQVRNNGNMAPEHGTTGALARIENQHVELQTTSDAGDQLVLLELWPSAELREQVGITTDWQCHEENAERMAPKQLDVTASDSKVS